MGFFIFITWLILSICVGVYASNKGRSGIGLFLVSLIFSPLIGFVIAAAMQPDAKAIEDKQIESGDSIRCPHCAEIVKRIAKVCKHCGKDLVETAEKGRDTPPPNDQGLKCPTCRETLIAENDIYTCPSCKKTFNQNYVF